MLRVTVEICVLQWNCTNLEPQFYCKACILHSGNNIVPYPQRSSGEGFHLAKCTRCYKSLSYLSISHFTVMVEHVDSNQKPFTHSTFEVQQYSALLCSWTLLRQNAGEFLFLFSSTLGEIRGDELCARQNTALSQTTLPVTQIIPQSRYAVRDHTEPPLFSLSSFPKENSRILLLCAKG